MLGSEVTMPTTKPTAAPTRRRAKRTKALKFGVLQLGPVKVFGVSKVIVRATQSKSGAAAKKRHVSKSKLLAE